MIDDHTPQTMAMQQLQGSSEGARLSDWLADYSHDLKEEGDFDQEAAQLDKASQWLVEAAARIEALEAEVERLRDALRTIRLEIDSQCDPLTTDTIDLTNPIPGDPPVQQQPNDAVFPGFRGNNEA